MAKVSAAEMDAIILTIPRLTVRQLDRLDDLIHRERRRKCGTVAVEVAGENSEGDPNATT